ncbi:MAG: hypothetical protein EAY65_06580 [Alphaproteobacteria bacterium]|nr:MAG: hypothetical protein EAY65_06580 [Alphaproteobacteria bacterium]
MVTTIQLGTIFTQNDRRVMSGGQSGIDIESLINGLSETRRLPAVNLEERIEENQKIATSLGEMRTILDRFRDAANFLRNPPGVFSEAENIFEFRNASVSSNTAVSGSSYLDVTAEPGAQVTDYTITDVVTATRNVQTTGVINVANASTSIVGGGGPFTAGTFTVGATPQNIAIVNGDTLNSIANKVNATTTQSGVEAVVMQVGTNQFRLSFRTVNTGAAQNYTFGAGATGITVPLTQSATDASLTIDGVSVTRSSNTISDVIDNVTLTLKQSTPPATALEVEIDADRELAKQGIMNFVDAYNQFRLFQSRQTQRDDNGLPTEDSVLSRSRTLSITGARLASELSSAISGILPADPARLSDIGITFADYPGDEETPFTRNILRVDETKLQNALSGNFDKVRKVFEFDFSSNNSDLQIFSRTNGLRTNSFTLNVNQGTSTYTAVVGGQTINLDASPITGGTGVTLRGQAGTALEGLVMLYSSATPASMTVNISQGFGDRLYNTLDEVLATGTGLLDSEVSSLGEQNERFETSIARIDAQIVSYRELLLRKYTSLEALIARSNTLLQTLDAQSRAREQ